jgi:hypothetical protein
MRKLMILSAVMLSLLMLPAMASATHFTYLTAMGDCIGYAAETGVHFRSTVDSFDLDYTVTLSDMDGVVLETFSDAMTVTGSGDIVLNFSDEWTVFATGRFTVAGTYHLVSTYPGGVDEETVEFSNEIQCTVASEDVSFDSVKSMYR